MGKTCVLFGAGADADYGIKCGNKFALNVIGEGTDEMNEAIKNFYSNLFKKTDNKWWLNDIKKVSKNNEELLCKKLYKDSLRKKHLIEKYGIEEKLTIKEFEKQINDSYNKLKKRKDKKKELLNSYASYMEIIDEKFHCLIYPRYLGPDKFWSVVYCYCRAYLTIVNDLCAYAGYEKNYRAFLENPKENLKALMEKIKAKEMMKDKERKDGKTYEYYHTIKTSLLENNDIKVITTNYTPLCQLVTGLTADKIAYVHGKLTFFESPYKSKVYDVEENGVDIPANEIYFPYIFIQSGVKPIIDSLQIKEYNKAVTFLEECDKLIIVGYKINIDDNHISGLIRNLCENKKIIYLDYDNFGDETIKKLLRLDKIDLFEYKKIDESNAKEEFRRIL